jgi:hypothetical protein
MILQWQYAKANGRRLGFPGLHQRYKIAGQNALK